MTTTQKIKTFLWFDDNAEEAVAHYVAIFKHSRVLDVTRYGDAGPRPKGSVMTTTFELEGQQFVALNGGPHFKFTEAISLFVTCETQAELDELWARLTEGGAPSQCGWLKDKFGLSWQVVPSALMRLIADPDPGRAARATQAMLTMTKLDIAQLEAAAAAAS